jgi:hypothetical protein
VAWQPIPVQVRSDADGTTYQLTQDGRTVRVRFHRDGSIRLAGLPKGATWLDAHGKPTPREHGYPVVRVYPQPT